MGIVEQLIRSRTSLHPDDIWLKWEDSTFTWQEVLSYCQRIANGLIELGAVPGDIVGIICRNRPEFLWAHFGASFMGVKSVPINISQRGNALTHILNDSAAKFIIVERELLPDLSQLLESSPSVTKIIVIDCDEKQGKYYSFEQLYDAPDCEPQVQVENAVGAAGMLYTSGTTGPPKGVVSDRVDGSGFLPILTAMGVSAGETMYCALPLFHGNGLLISTLGSMVLDAKLALSSKFSASRFFEEASKFEAVEFNALGAMISILLSRPVSSSDREHKIRTVLSAGCPPNRWREFEERFGVKLVEFYGMVDAPGLLLNQDGKIGSMGKPVGGCEFEVFDDADKPLPPGQVGELVFRTPLGASTSYHNNPEATNSAWRDGWFHTGDSAEKDDEGYFYFKGRKKESIRRLGENISPWEIESVVNAHPEVLESAAHAVPSELGEDEVKLCVVLDKDSSLTHSELFQYCQGKMASYCVPRYIEFVDAIPKTETLKIQYQKLRSTPFTPNTWDHLGGEVRGDVGGAIPGDVGNNEADSKSMNSYATLRKGSSNA